MLKSIQLGGLWPGLALILAAALLLVACGGVGADAPQNAAAAEPTRSETMTEVAEVEEITVEEIAVEEEPVAEAVVEAVATAGVEEMVPAEEEVLAETKAMVEPEPVTEAVVETESEPMLEETELAETDDSASEELADEMADQGQTVELEEMDTTDEEVMPEEVTEMKPVPTEEQLQLLQSLKVLGSPAELHNEIWLNSEPLKLADLRGQVAIVEFWTYG